MGRKLFCEISPTTYKISMEKNILQRHLKDFFSKEHFARKKSNDLLPVIIKKHNSLIRRRLGNVDMQLQENKAVNLSIAAPCVNGVIIRPGETFSFWRLVGRDTRKRGFKEGLAIARAVPRSVKAEACASSPTLSIGWCSTQNSPSQSTIITMVSTSFPTSTARYLSERAPASSITIWITE